MDAINFGTECWFSPCNGGGPWVQADLENGLFQSNVGHSTNTSNTGNGAPFVTAMLKNNGTNFFALKDGNAQSGGLATRYSGALPTSPSGYSPMHKEGAIILGIGGDNSNGSIGSFFEGVMTSGQPSDATENPSSSSLDKNDASWIVRRGLASSSCVSFESRNFPGDFLRHSNFQLFRQPMDGTTLFRQDGTFCPETGKNGQGNSFRSFNFSTRYIRHFNNTVYIASNGGSNAFDSSSLWTDDVSLVVTAPWAP